MFGISNVKRSLFLFALIAFVPTVISGTRNTNTINLPLLNVQGVKLEDGIDLQEATALSRKYFLTYISGCGGPDQPKRVEKYWKVDLHGGYSGDTDFGTLLIAIDGSAVSLESPTNGLQPITRFLLKENHVPID